MKQSLRLLLSDALAESLGIDSPKSIQWTIPKRSNQGDLSTNIAMILAKKRGINPRQLAQDAITVTDWKALGIERVEIAGPGFINCWISPAYYQGVVRNILEEKEKSGESDLGGGKKIIVEFVSANPTGPLNIVSARAGAIGDSLVRILKKAGFDAHSEYYVNDSGGQIERLGKSVLAHHHGQQVPEDGYHGEDVAVSAQILAEQLSELSDNPLEAGKLAAELNLEKQQQILENYGITFNRWFRESELHNRHAPQKVLDRLREAGCIYEKEGATWFAGSRFGDSEDRVVITREGRPTYLLPDIAYHLDKASRGFDLAIDLLGPDHHDYINRMQAALTALGLKDFLETIIVQQVHLYSGGERLKMSKRAGRIVTLEQLISEVGVDVARYFFLQRRASSPLDFDLDLAKEQSERNPVFYVQYAHTRICGILRQPGCPDPWGNDLSLLNSPAEIQLMKHLETFQQVVEIAAEQREPLRIVQFLHELANTFHKFYTSSRVVGEEPRLAAARASLIQASRLILAEGLQLLGVSAPEKM